MASSARPRTRRAASVVSARWCPTQSAGQRVDEGNNEREGPAAESDDGDGPDAAAGRRPAKEPDDGDAGGPGLPLADWMTVERLKGLHSRLLETLDAYDSATKNIAKDRERDILQTCQHTVKAVGEQVRRKLAKEYETKTSHDSCNNEIRSLARELRIVKLECSRILAQNEHMDKELSVLRRYKATYESEMQMVLGVVGRLRIRNRILRRKLKEAAAAGRAATQPWATDVERAERRSAKTADAAESGGEDDETDDEACDEVEWEALNSESSRRRWNGSTMPTGCLHTSPVSCIQDPSAAGERSAEQQPAKAAIAVEHGDVHARCKDELGHMRTMFLKEEAMKRAIIKECNGRSAAVFPMLQLLRACIRDIRQAAQRRPFANADEDGPCGSGKPRSQSASAARRDDRRDADLVFATNLAHDRRILEIVEGLIRRAAAPEKQAAEGRPPGEPDENVLDLADAATGEKPKKSVQISELPRNDIVDAAGPGAKTRRARACEERPKSAPSSRFLHPPSAPPDEPAAEAATAAGGRPKSRGDLPRSGAGKAAAPQTPGGTRSPGRGPPAAPPGTRDEGRGRAEHAKFVVKGLSVSSCAANLKPPP